MTADEFNKKYREYCEDGFEDHGPLEFNNPKVTLALDYLFEEFLIKQPGFKVAQIKLKFGKARFYSSLSPKLESMVEKLIDEIIEETKTK